MPDTIPYRAISSINELPQSYQELFKHLRDDNIYLFQQQFEKLMPQNYSEISASFFDSQIERHYFREFFIKEFGFAAPSKKTFGTIARYSPLLEIGAGTGYWSRMLDRFYRCNIIATDLKSGMSSYKFQIGKYFQVNEMSAKDSIKQYYDRNVFLSWPSYNDPWAADAIQDMKPGQFLIYIGEGEGGCCADDNFFKILNNDFDEIESEKMLQFFWIHDYLSIYRKKESKNLVSEYNVMRALEI